MANYVKCYLQNPINYTIVPAQLAVLSKCCNSTTTSKAPPYPIQPGPSCLAITHANIQATWVHVNASSLLPSLQRSQIPFLYAQHPVATRQMKASSA